jgi:hypothetical protein
MNRITPKNVKEKMVQALALIKEAVDMSIPLLKTERQESIVMLWETFIGEFIDYIKLRSKETGVNLISKISIRRIWFK